VTLVGPGAERQSVVVRRYGTWRLEHDPQAAEREWATLQALAEVGAPTPRPIWLDAGGEMFGSPTVVISRMPGRGLLAPRDLDGWIRQLAEALVTIHAMPLHAEALGLLGDQRAEISKHLAPAEPPERIAKRPFGPELWSAMQHWWPRMEASEPALVHGDYWPGNTLWHRGRLSGVIDWEQARRGDPTQDVACCRLDLTLLFGPETADAFAAAYLAAGGRVVRHLFFWELVVASFATDDVEEWVKGYHDLGGTEVQPGEARARLERFAATALAMADRYETSEG
jgi:aminoglycoside phosphotransferase (APT) family kinase protein